MRPGLWRRSASILVARFSFAEQPEIALGILERYEQACLDDKGAHIPTVVEFPARVVPGLADRLASAYGRGMKDATLGWIAYARRQFEDLGGKDHGLL